MNRSSKREARTSRRQVLAATAATLGATGLRPSRAAATGMAAQPPVAGRSFALIFRQGSGQPTAAELQKRAQETRAWAQQQNAAGHNLEPHILASDGRWIGPDGAEGAPPADSGGLVTAILFVAARDLAQATEIARAHPARRYGASVEVRPWAPPPSSTASSQAPAPSPPASR